ncbi:MAG: endonuclease/exonuclease/phosphatase family protein [Deltaproteobacteria bacterium]|nr:endonuclease/exonuclease/phosphatase family protein [Deltaproteobacteria bacterium]
MHDPWRVPDHHHIGVLFDGARWRAASTRTHDGTAIGPLDLPVLEVRLADTRSGEVTRVYVVHFRPKTSGRPVRVAQHAVLARIVVAGRASGEDVFVLGDFNATEAADRDDLAALARAADLAWATEALACTAFWIRPDGCARSRLDHVLTSRRPARAEVAGGCATHGCEREDTCPAYVERVSDHCPVAVDQRD